MTAFSGLFPLVSCWDTLRGIVTLKQGCTCSFIVVQQQLTSECANHGLLNALPWLHIMPYRRLDSMGPVNFMIVLSSLDIHGLKFQWTIVVFLPVYVRRLSSDLGFPSLNLNGELWWNIFFLFISCYSSGMVWVNVATVYAVLKAL